MWTLRVYLLMLVAFLCDSAAAISRVPDLSAGHGAPTRSSTVARTARAPTATRRLNSTRNVKRVAPARAVTARTKGVKARSGTAQQTIETMSLLSDLQKTCKTQYTECMDYFCNVLDSEQGRCTCSKNIKNYTKTETALKQATEELQDVAQKIGYIGLSADEITVLFSQTEAEQIMQNKSDNTQLKSDLERIKDLVVKVKSSTVTAADSNTSFDLSGLLDFSVSGTGGDLLSMFNTNGTSSISNQRGEQLYKTAVARCKASVLNTCATQGVDVSLLSNSYDIEIDRQCVAYERGLADKNKQMQSTIHNANTVLQKARLMVAQKNNTYDLRGCVAAMDSCMRDDTVCGENYEQCMDPTGKYIVDGSVVIGSNIGAMNISEADIGALLRAKIGVIDGSGRATGFCSSVMQKCQNYTMKNGKYDENNALLAEYLSRTNTIITKNRSALIAEYAAGCMSDMFLCLNTNGGGATSLPSDAAINACRGVITTCKSATGSGDVSNVKKWLQDMLGVSLSQGNSSSTTPSQGGESQDNNSSTEPSQRCELYGNNLPKEMFFLNLPRSDEVVRIAANSDSSQCWPRRGDVTNILFDSAKQQCVLLVDSEYYTETNTQIQMRWRQNMKCAVFGGVETDGECAIPKQQTNIVEKISLSEKYCMLTPYANFYNNTCRCDAGYEMINLNYRNRPYLCVPVSATNKAKQCWRSGMAYDATCDLCITNLTDDLLTPLDEASCNAIDGDWWKDYTNGKTTCSCDRKIYGPRCAGLLDPAKYSLEVYAFVQQGYCSKFNGVEIDDEHYNCKILVHDWYWTKNLAGDMRLVEWAYHELTEFECSRLFMGPYVTYQNDTCILYGQSEMKYEYIAK